MEYLLRARYNPRVILPPSPKERPPHPERLLLGPGPSLVHPRVLSALNKPILGHLDPSFLSLMSETQELLRWVFQASNPFTIAVSGTGSAAMEMALVNLIEPGDRVVVCVNGVFGERLWHIVQRCGGAPIRLEAPWGQPIPLERVEECLSTSKPVKAVALVHAETSTGVLQPLEGFGSLCHQYEALSILDAVTSLGGLPVTVDRWEIDACYAATQKCLSCPPGVAPLTLSTKAIEVVQRRKTPCQSWYFDSSLIQDYWEEGKRTYHHTAPISMIYALHESLRLILEEGLPSRFHRHQVNSRALQAGLEILGFTRFSPPTCSLPTLHCMRLPDYLADQPARTHLLQEYHIEIGGGLGPLAGKVWRIGLMGESSQQTHVLTFLHHLEAICLQSGGNSEKGQARQAAEVVYDHPLPS